MPAGVIGRDEELGSVDALLERVQRAPAALVFTGEPGVGKTVLWEVALERARRRGVVVLAYRGVEAEANVAFAALVDLLADVLDDALPLLPAPRRRALEVALLLEDPGGQAPDQRAIGLGLSDILRTLAASGPVLVAMDDLQWLDRSSSAVLQFALRRLRNESVGFVAAMRDAPNALDPRTLMPGAPVEQIALHPLTVGAAYRLLTERLGLALSRPQLIRLHEVTGGNAFYLLELGREFSRIEGRLAAGQPLPVPRDLTELLAQRLGRLPAPARDVLLTVAALPKATLHVLEAARADDEHMSQALERARRAGVIELDGSRIRFAHPLLASVCYQTALPGRRRAVHRSLASSVSEPEERARHLALAADGPDAAVASALAQAAERAAARGATASAAELAELAAEATPPGSADGARRRRLRAAEFHRLAGDRDRAAGILEQLLGEAPDGTERADVLFALAQGRRTDVPGILALCNQALNEARGDDARCTRILVYISWMRLIDGDVQGALTAAREGLRDAERLDDAGLLATAIARVAMAETWALDITPGLVERGVALEATLDRPLQFHESPKIALARRLIILGDLERARLLLEEAEEQAGAHADEGSRGHVLFHLIMLEWFAGRWDRALAHAAAGLAIAEQLRDDQFRGMVQHARALVEAHLGDTEAARASAHEAAVSAEATSDAIFAIWNLGVLGHIDLSLGRVEAAADRLGALPQRLLSMGWHDPVDSVWPDAIEALIGVGAVERAEAYLGRFEELARRSGSPWALATAGRCRGLLATAEGDADAANSAFEGALSEHGRMEGSFELGRTLLALGSARRRARQKRASREALDQAIEIFERHGARTWEGRARDERARIGGRRPGPKELTVTEERVASLAADGLANKEIAATLFMSVHTVEAHLTRVYRKLGVRSRTDLARHADISADALRKT